MKHNNSNSALVILGLKHSHKVSVLLRLLPAVNVLSKASFVKHHSMIKWAQMNSEPPRSTHSVSNVFGMNTCDRCVAFFHVIVSVVKMKKKRQHQHNFPTLALLQRERRSSRRNDCIRLCLVIHAAFHAQQSIKGHSLGGVRRGQPHTNRGI